MSELETKKYTIVNELRSLCAHCATGRHDHSCPVREISARVESLSGVPLIVNSQFKGVLWPRFGQN